MRSHSNTMLSSFARVTILVLLKASVRIAASKSCTDMATIFGAVTKEALHIGFNTRLVNEGYWTLEAHVKWNNATPFRGMLSGIDLCLSGTTMADANHLKCHTGYALQMSQDPLASFCTSYVTTVNRSYEFTNLMWGTEYYFKIAIAKWDSNSTLISLFQTKMSKIAPGVTQFKYSKVIDVRLDCIVRDVVEPTFLTASISWLPPDQVNGTLFQVEIKYWKAKHTEEYHELDNIIHLREITEDEPSSRYISEISELEAEQHYTIEVRMYMKFGPALVSNQPVQYHFNTTNLTTDFVAYIEPNSTVEACYAIPPTMPPVTLPVRSAVYNKGTTFMVLILLSILAVLTIVALILCYSRKRPISHLPKPGIFGRFPNHAASGLNKSSETEALRQKGTPLFDGECDASRGDVWQTVQSSLGVNIFYEPHTPPSLSENDPIFMTKEFNRSFLRIEDKLGSGQFGVVYKAFALGLDGTDKYQPVAVKSLKVDATDAMKVDFLNEIKLIIEIGSHPNILPILGCCTTEEPFYLITEFMKYGDLLRFLMRCKEEIYQEQDNVYKVTKRGQLQIARQIARGMEYLSSTRYYHGDLAARNVLVGEDLVVKISDFGMADDIYQQGYKRLAPERKRPVKWVSLETNTRGQCTIQSDVWSFGIVLYEIYTFGDVPYPGLDGRDVVRALDEGFRMDRPDNCSNEIYEIMLQCWHENPYDRPSFTELYTRLDDMLSQSSDDYICDLEINVRYHPDTSQTFRASSPIPIAALPYGGYGPDFEIDECTC